MKSAVAAAEPARPRTGRGLKLAPILRASHAQIRELGARRATSLSHIQRTVENDPAVALNLFAEVNANLKRVGHAPVGDIPRAILFMGMAELPGRICQAMILEDVVTQGLGDELTRMLCRAHHASRQARTIGALAGGLNGEELLAAALTREGLPYLERIAREPGTELDLIAFNNFLPAPPDGHDAQVASTKCLDLAARFADATEQAWDETALDGLYAEIQDFTGRSANDIARRLRLATVEAARAGVHYPAYAPAIHLMSPGETARSVATVGTAPVPTQAPTVAAPAAPSAPKRRQRPATKPDTAASRSKTAQAKPAAAPQNRTALKKTLAEIERSAAAGATAAAILPLGLQAICDGTGMRLALLLMRDKTSADLRLRAHRGLEVPAAFTQRAITLDGNPLLEKLMAKPAAFHWRPDQHAHMLSGLPLKLLGGKPAFLFSLHVDEKPLGILVGCRPHTVDAEPGLAFTAFKRIGAVTREGLLRSRRLARS